MFIQVVHRFAFLEFVKGGSINGIYSRPWEITADIYGGVQSRHHAKEDIEAINYAITSGVKGIFTAHGKDLNDITLNPILSKLYNLKIIERIILIQDNRELKLIYSK